MKKELTKREKEVLKLISKGLTAKEIGKQLGISKRTIEAHTANMLQKTEAKNKAHLLMMSIMSGELEVEGMNWVVNPNGY